MLQILAHRGLWNASPPNSLEAIEAAFSHGFGIETDVRDRDGMLVISHDLPTHESPSFEDALAIYRRHGGTQLLALNVKADGINHLLRAALQRHAVTNYFTFDMSVPQLISYQREGLITYTRQSEFETDPSRYEQSQGVWVDAFERDWIDAQTLLAHYRRGKALAVVSPELHKRDRTSAWKVYRSLLKAEPAIELSLCTDFPREAQEYFDAAH